MITQAVTFSDWWNWLQSSESYKNNFSYDGAQAVFDYMEEYSESTESEADNFDPIAWCVEFTEYDSVKDAYREHYGDDSDLPKDQRRTTKAQQLEYFQDNTTVLELENGHIILGEF